MQPTSKQSTVIALLFTLLVGAITVTALAEYAVDDFLKVWAVIGTLVGVTTGAIPSFFFANAASAAQQTARRATELHSDDQQRLQTLLGVAGPDVLHEARARRPDLFQAPSTQSSTTPS